jgi:hypothetical protein
MKFQINKGSSESQDIRLTIDPANTSKWHVGDGAPEDIKNAGDFYLDKLSGNFYTQNAAGWELTGNIKGKDGHNPVHVTNAQPDNAVEGDIWVHNGLRVLDNGTWREITGNSGQDGETVKLRYSNGYLQSKYESQTEWTNLTAINELVGPRGAKGEKGDKGDKGDKGEPGQDGKEVELRKSKDYIQWRYEGGVWKNLVALSELKGTTETIAVGGGGGVRGIMDIIAGTNITIDKTNPFRKPRRLEYSSTV